MFLVYQRKIFNIFPAAKYNVFLDDKSLKIAFFDVTFCGGSLLFARQACSVLTAVVINMIVVLLLHDQH